MRTCLEHENLSGTTYWIWYRLRPYAFGEEKKNVSIAVVIMFEHLADEIASIAHEITGSGLTFSLRHRDGIDPVQKFEEKGFLDDLNSHLAEIRRITKVIYDYTPKFQDS